MFANGKVLKNQPFPKYGFPQVADIITRTRILE